MVPAVVPLTRIETPAKGSFWASLTTPLMVIVPYAQVTSGLLRSIAKVSSTTLAVKYLEKYFIFVS